MSITNVSDTMTLTNSTTYYKNYRVDISLLTIFYIYICGIIMMGIVIYYQCVSRYITQLCCWCRQGYPSRHEGLIIAPTPTTKTHTVSSYRDRKPPNLTVDTDLPTELDL